MKDQAEVKKESAERLDKLATGPRKKTVTPRDKAVIVNNLKCTVVPDGMNI